MPETIAEFKQALLDEADSTDVADGLVEGPQPESAAEQVAKLEADPDFQARQAEAERFVDANAEREARYAELERKATVDLAWSVLDDDEASVEDRAAAFSALSPSEKMRAYEDGLIVDQSEAEYLDHVADELRAQELRAEIAATRTELAEHNDAARDEFYARMQTENRLTREQAVAQYKLVDTELRKAVGHGLDSVPADALPEVWNTTVAGLELERSRNEENRILRSFSEPSGNVSEGLEVLSDGRWVKPFAVNVPARKLTPREVHAAAKSVSKARTPRDLKRSILDDTPTDKEWDRVQKVAGELFDRHEQKFRDEPLKR